MYKNPILKGFNPDPSIIRVDNDYFIANSTFEWFPGVQLHHSKDLVNWKLIAHPLNRKSQLDMKGNPDSCGVWAPCLSYHNGTYYLVYTDVKSFDGCWKDTHNFLVTTNDINGDWSEPIYLNSCGFDPSLFHDDDGRKWYVSLYTDHRNNKLFGGIILQEYSEKEKKLIGPVKNIFKGTRIGLTEGPHLYKIHGYYYLLTAEGGTEYNHAVSLARSKTIDGPFEVHPENPVITAANNPELPIQKSGHGDLIQTQQGNWYMVYLCGRPLEKLGRCTLGRETCIQKMKWKKDGWLYTDSENPLPEEIIEQPSLPEHKWPQEPNSDHFDSDILNINYQSLRIPIENNWCSLTDRKGFLRLYGRESLSSIHNQSLIARRIQSFKLEVETSLEFNPISLQQMAGLVFYYNTWHFHYLHVSHYQDENKKILTIITNDNGITTEQLQTPVDISNTGTIFLKAAYDRDKLQFYYSLDNLVWIEIGPTLNTGILSDDYVRDNGLRYRPAFTGSFVGLCCQDLSGNKLHADFDWFTYSESPNY